MLKKDLDNSVAAIKITLNHLNEDQKKTFIDKFTSADQAFLLKHDFKKRIDSLINLDSQALDGKITAMTPEELRQILDYAEHKVNGILDEYGRVIPIIVYK
jgi:hypothetical protein